MWRRNRERDLAAELESHLELHIADNLRAGMTPEAARRQALVALGGVEPTKERYRAAFAFRWIDALIKDIQFSLRAMRRDLGFSTNTAFTITNTVMLRELASPRCRPAR